MTDVTSLVSLIDEVETRNGGWSDRRVAEQAVGRGYNLSKSDMSNYRRRGMPQIVPAKIVALAEGLRIPAYRVALAVLADHGITFPEDIRTPEVAVQSDPTLSAQLRESLLMLIEHGRQELP